MLAVIAFAAATAMAQPMAQNPPKPDKPRFELASPLPGAPAVKVDMNNDGSNLANMTARARGLQGRVLWVDATANIDRYNDEQKIQSLIKKVDEVGFNTIVLDVKPISGHVIYPSKLAPKLTEWRERKLPVEFDPVAVFVRECKSAGISLMVSFNAFSEGHAMFKTGPGYQKEGWPTVLYEPRIVLRGRGDNVVPMNQQPNRPVDEGLVTYYNNAASLPKPDPTLYAVMVDWPAGAVIETTDTLAAQAKALSIPRRGYVLAAIGPAAQALRHAVGLRQKPKLDTEAQFIPITERPDDQVPMMVNPVNPEVRQYELEVMREFLRAYEVDGVMYDDRFRYGGINADFSDLTRARFEEHVGEKLQWPDDVFKFTVTQTFARGIAPGRYYSAWMAWRAMVLRDYLAEVKKLVDSERPSTLLGLYAGSWYGEYPAYGANLGSTKLQGGFWFLTDGYRRAGMASIYDFLMTGGYYPTPTIHDGLKWGTGIGNTIEAAGRLTSDIVRDEAWSYVGIMLSQFKNDPDRLMDALQAACWSTQGVMVFDLSHDIDHLWPAFARAFSQRRPPPHLHPGALAQVRKLRSEYDARGHLPAPPIISLGSAGTGL